MAARHHLNCEEREIVLATEPASVVLKPRGSGVERLSEAREVVVIGQPYWTEDEARQAASQWRDVLTRAFRLRPNLGADFGERAATSVLTHAGREILERQLGRRVMNDTHGVEVFDPEPWPMFFGSSVELGVGRSFEVFERAVTEALEIGVHVSDRERVAFDLYSASSWAAEASVDARFLLLMSAVEALIVPEPREPEVRAHVDSLIAATEKADIPEHQAKSIIGTLRWLYDDSINQAGRKLAASLGDRAYLDMPAPKFFTRCYSIRSALVHGADDFPSRDLINQYGGALKLFVRDLLAGELRDVVRDLERGD